ncbi:hypothetical protein [Acetomicrobium sp.]|uniref:hypothetical protein n=1 Tax=Acetomicrobium sp. TaxID=1872099 RepID=UPI001BD0CA15|nr:hypothetical protein [Acetomicrobium sp.]
MKASFPKAYRQILSMAYSISIAARGGPPLPFASLEQKPCPSLPHPFRQELTSQRNSVILRSLGVDGKKTFFKRWA